MNQPISLDHFLDRGFAVRQFRNSGHRSGMDAVLLAATVPGDQKGYVADLGAGVGVVGMAVAHRCPWAGVDLFELDQDLVSQLYAKREEQKQKKLKEMTKEEAENLRNRLNPKKDYMDDIKKNQNEKYVDRFYLLVR